MAFSKAHRFEPSLHHLSLLCHALAHPARVKILIRLLDQPDDMIRVKDLHRGIPISLPTFSQHLKVLRDMHILTCREESPHVYYGLNGALPDVIDQLRMIITMTFGSSVTFNSLTTSLLYQRKRSGTIPL